jgi:hypothetical protein
VSELCCADRNHGVNYHKPHVWVPAVCDGHPAESCLYCGKDREVKYIVTGRSDTDYNKPIEVEATSVLNALGSLGFTVFTEEEYYRYPDIAAQFPKPAPIGTKR